MTSSRTLMFSAAVAAVALFGIVGTALAAWTYDLDAETGFVGKGDVQTALNLNNSQLQSQAGQLSFAIKEIEIFQQLCERGETQQQTRTRTSNITATVAYEPRRQNQVTGFNLGSISGSTEVVDGNLNCPNPSSGWVPAGDPEFVFASLELFVNGASLGVISE